MVIWTEANLIAKSDETRWEIKQETFNLAHCFRTPFWLQLGLTHSRPHSKSHSRFHSSSHSRLPHNLLAASSDLQLRMSNWVTAPAWLQGHKSRHTRIRKILTSRPTDRNVADWNSRISRKTSVDIWSLQKQAFESKCQTAICEAKMILAKSRLKI